MLNSYLSFHRSVMSLPSGRYRIVHQASSNLVTLPDGRRNAGIVLAPYNNSATQTVCVVHVSDIPACPTKYPCKWEITAVGTDEEYTMKSVAFPTVFAAHTGISEGAALGSSMTSVSWVLTTKDDAYYT